MSKEGCISCGQTLEDSKDTYPTDHGEGIIYENCYQQERREPAATLVHTDGAREWISPHISSYGLRGGKAPAKLSWTRVDPWRGYYALQPTDEWSILHSDPILRYSQNATKLQEFDKQLTTRLKKMGIKYIKAFTKTSNLFSTGYDLLVPEDQINKAKAVSIILALKYRDPQKFKATALTGKYPNELTPQDKLLVYLVEKLNEGEEPQNLLGELSSS